MAERVMLYRGVMLHRYPSPAVGGVYGDLTGGSKCQGKVCEKESDQILIQIVCPAHASDPSPGVC